MHNKIQLNQQSSQSKFYFNLQKSFGQEIIHQNINRIPVNIELLTGI